MNDTSPDAGLRWSRRRLLSLPFALGVPLGAVAADATLSKPLTLVIPFVPGTVTDLVPRMLAPSMGETLGQPLVFEHKAGGSGIIAAQFVVRAPADGSTVFAGTSTAITINPHVHAKLPYRPLEDFAPVCPVAVAPSVMTSRPDFPAQNVGDVVRLARQSPGRYTYASFGNGTSAHLLMEHLKHEAGIDIRHIPYKSGGTATAALMGGDVDLGFDSLFNGITRAKAGQTKMLGIMQAQRSAMQPQLPSTTDAGFPQVGLTTWVGLFAPAATPTPVLDTIGAAVRKALGQPGMAARLAEMGAEPLLIDRPAFARMLRDEYDKMGTIVKLARIEPT